MTGNFDLLLTAWQDFQIALMVLDTPRMFDDLYSSPISFMLTAVFVLRMQHNMCYVFHSCGTSHCIAWFSFLMTPSSSFCLLPKEVLWPFRFPWYRTQVTKATEKKKLQRERRQMQAKHLWYNLDIRWVDLEEKLEVLAPTEQRKNPYEEGCYNGEDFEDVKRKWEAKKEYFLEYKKDGSHPPCIDLAMALHGFGIDNTARTMQLKTRRHYMHVDGRQKKVFTVLRGRLCLMYVMHLSTMTMLLPLAQMPNRDGGTGMKTMLWDINVIPN